MIVTKGIMLCENNNTNSNTNQKAGLRVYQTINFTIRPALIY